MDGGGDERERGRGRGGVLPRPRRIVVVGAAAYALLLAVSTAGVVGVVAGWTDAFALAVSLPVLATRAATALYGRVGG